MFSGAENITTLKKFLRFTLQDPVQFGNMREMTCAYPTTIYTWHNDAALVFTTHRITIAESYLDMELILTSRTTYLSMYSIASCINNYKSN